MQGSNYYMTKTDGFRNSTDVADAALESSIHQLNIHISTLTTATSQLQSNDTVITSQIGIITNQLASINSQLNAINNKLSKLYPTASNTGATSTMLTASQVLGGIIVSTPNVDTVILTLPMASQLVQADSSSQIGKGYAFTIINSSTAYSIIVSTGTGPSDNGITVVGNPIVSINESANFYISYDNITPNTEAVTIYRR